MSIDKSDSGGPSKVLDYPCSQDRKVNVGVCPSTVVGSSPESVERETSHGMAQGSMLKQVVNFPIDLSDTVTQTSEGIDTVMAEAWEAQCETSPDLALSRFWELEQGQVTDVLQITASPMDH